MKLDANEKLQFRKKMLEAFDLSSLNLFLQDYLNIEADVTFPNNVSFEQHCQNVIQWFERQDRQIELLQAILQHHQNSTFKNFVSEALVNKKFERTEPFTHYLKGLLSATSYLKIPGFNQPIELEALWVRPTFITGEGATPLHKILAKRAVAIEARAGYGKTTLSKMVAISLAKDFLGQNCPAANSWQKLYLGVESGAQQHLPILVDLRQVKEFGDAECLTIAATPSISKDEHTEIERLVKGGGNVVYILDGLDEIDDFFKSRVIELINKIRLKWPKCYFIVTSRSFSREALAGSPIEDSPIFLAQMTTLSIRGSEELAKKWDAILESISASSKSKFSLSLKNTSKEESYDSFLASPLVIAFLASTFLSNGKLFSNNAELLARISDWLLKSRSKIRELRGVDLSTTKKVLESFAFSELHRKRRAATLVDEAVTNVANLTGFPASIVEKIIDIESSASNCLVQTNRRLEFWHGCLRDFFAANWLFSLFRESGGVAVPSEMKAVFADGNLQDVGDMLIGLLATQDNSYLINLVEKTTPVGHLLIDHVRAAALHSRILDVATAHGFRFDGELERRISRQASLSLNIPEKDMLSMSLADRVEALRALSRLGKDSRLFGPPLRRALSTNISNIFIGKFPVTVQEYGRYLKDASTALKDGRALRLPLAWEQQLETRNAPVTGVDWVQANNYCIWLTRSMSSESLTTIARLPTLKEWYALTGVNGRKGDHSKLITTPTFPVGVYLEEVGPFGHQNLSHGVSEWIGPSLATKRRRKSIICSNFDNDRATHHPIWRRVRGSLQSTDVGFRVVFERVIG